MIIFFQPLLFCKVKTDRTKETPLFSHNYCCDDKRERNERQDSFTQLHLITRQLLFPSAPQQPLTLPTHRTLYVRFASITKHLVNLLETDSGCTWYKALAHAKGIKHAIVDGRSRALHEMIFFNRGRDAVITRSPHSN